MPAAAMNIQFFSKKVFSLTTRFSPSPDASSSCLAGVKPAAKAALSAFAAGASAAGRERHQDQSPATRQIHSTAI
jgi:hypothetical protein